MNSFLLPVNEGNTQLPENTSSRVVPSCAFAQIFRGENTINGCLQPGRKSIIGNGHKVYMLLLTVIFTVMAFTTGYASTETINLTAANLTNCGNNCGGGNYNPCNGTNIGFTWTDGIPAGNMITGVTIEFEIGVECSPGVRTWYLNGTPEGIFKDFGNGCACTGTGSSLTVVGTNGTNYSVGGANSFVLTAGSSCEGFYPWSGSVYAQIVVQYTPAPGYNNGYGTFAGATIAPACGAQQFNLPSTSYTYFTAAAGVTYNFSLSGSGWSNTYINAYYYNSSVWVPLVNGSGSISVTPNSGNLTYNGAILIGVSNTVTAGIEPNWIGNSGVLTYQITPPTTPGITQSPASGGHVCTGNNVTYTASGISVGSFDYFQYEWNGTGGYNAGWIGSNPGTWGSCCPGNVLYVEAVSQNGGCLAASSPVTVAVDNTSSAGSFVTSPIYSTADGTLYNGSGTLLSGESVTGYTGSITGWAWGTNTGTCTPVANAGGWPYNAGSANMNLNCCWPGVGSGSTDVILVGVTSGICAPAYNCISVTENAMVAPSGASVSPSLVCAPTSGTITLTYTGGFSGNIPGGVLKWYSGSCGGTLVGSGQNLSIAAPSGTTNYYCAWVDPKGNLTSCASTTFTVTPVPTVSASSYAICNGQPITLNSSVAGTWVSNNTSVLTVSGSTANAVNPGSTNFTFTSTAAPNCTASTPTVTVQAVPVVSITGPTSFCGTTTTTLSPTTGGTWVSNNNAVATVSGFTVTGTTAGGTTNFTFTNSTAPNCANTTANVTVTGLPTVFGVTGGGTYCLGSSDPIGLSGSQTGVMYQLFYNGSTPVGSPMSGTGTALSFPNQTTLGTYTVVATTVTNSCSLPMSGNAVVTTLSPSVTNNPGATGLTPTGGTLNGTD